MLLLRGLAYVRLYAAPPRRASHLDISNKFRQFVTFLVTGVPGVSGVLDSGMPELRTRFSVAETLGFGRIVKARLLWHTPLRALAWQSQSLLPFLQEQNSK